MTSPAQEALSVALANLAEVSKHYDELDTSEERRAALAQVVRDTESAAAKALVECKAARQEYEHVARRLDAQKRQLENARLVAGGELDAKIVAEQSALAEIEARVVKGRSELERVSAGLADAHRRLRFG
jgi:hypothetical protein